MKTFIDIMKEKESISRLLNILNYEEMINKYKSIESIDSMDDYFSYSALGLMIDIIDPYNRMDAIKHLQKLYEKNEFLQFKLKTIKYQEYLNNLKYELIAFQINDLESEYTLLSLLILYCSIEENIEKQEYKINQIENKLKNNKIIRLGILK